MKKRLEYMGGARQQDRMNIDKLKSLKRALLYSYQAATAVLSDGREFRCLINPNKLSMDLDNKILSIPFKDICLNADRIGTTTQGEVEIGIKEGDVIEWKENSSHWLVYLQRLEETAYFRADLRRCHYEITFETGSKYWAYVRGPVEQSIVWAQSSGNYYNKLNYTLVLYITKNEETLEYFKRFSKVIINNQPWEVQATDNISTPGIIEVSLKETYTNTIENDIEKAVEDAEKEIKVPEQNIETPYIYGLNEVYPYDIQQYEIKNYNGALGTWLIKNATRKNMAKILQLTEHKIELSIITGKSGTFTLAYEVEGNVIATLDIVVGSL